MRQPDGARSRRQAFRVRGRHRLHSCWGRLEEAGALFEGLVARHPGDQNLHINYAAVLLQLGDPQKAAAEAELGLCIDRTTRQALRPGTAWRMMAAKRDERLAAMTADHVFDLEHRKASGT